MPKPVSKKKKSEEEAAVAAAAEALRKIEAAALGFKALGDPTRLRIVLFLRAAAEAPFDKGGEPLTATGEESAAKDEAAGSGSTTVGAVALHLTGSDKVSSNISHHLKELRHAGLIAMKRRGKNILCRVEQDALDGLEGVLCGRNDETVPSAVVPGVTAVKSPAKSSSKKRSAEVTEAAESKEVSE